MTDWGGGLSDSTGLDPALNSAASTDGLGKTEYALLMPGSTESECQGAQTFECHRGQIDGGRGGQALRVREGSLRSIWVNAWQDRRAGHHLTRLLRTPHSSHGSLAAHCALSSLGPTLT